MSNRISATITDKLTALKALRDEIRLKIHLAGMDAKDAWRALEPRLEKIEQEMIATGEEAATDLEKSLDKLRKKFAALQGRLDGKPEKGAPPAAKP